MAIHSERRTFAALVLASASVLLAVGGLCTLVLVVDDERRHARGGIVALALPLFTCCAGFVLLGVHFWARRREKAWAGSAALTAFAAALGSALGAFCFTAVQTYASSHGRRFVRKGRACVAGPRSGRAWSAALELPIAGDALTRGAIAAEWRKTAAKEHASIPSFGQLALDLLVVGAPPRLLQAAHRAALDEVNHTTLCFSIAHAFDGLDKGPAPFPEARALATLPDNRVRALARIAVDAFLDGAVNEAYSARILGRLSKRAGSARLAAHLRAMASDESRHAADSWDVIAWCLNEAAHISGAAGAEVGARLHRAMTRLPRAVATDVPRVAADGRWERFGVQGRAMEESEYRTTRRHAERRLALMLSFHGLARAHATDASRQTDAA